MIANDDQCFEELKEMLEDHADFRRRSEEELEHERKHEGLKMKTKLIALTLALAVTGCASTRGSGAQYNPIVDRPGPSYPQDLADCQQHATKILGAADSAAAGAVAGAIFGTLLMAAAGGGSRYQRAGAWMGALEGGTAAAAAAEGGQRGIITRCLTGRGYRVLQ